MISDSDYTYYLVDSKNRLVNVNEKVKSRESYNFYQTPLRSNSGIYNDYIESNQYSVVYVHLKKAILQSSDYLSFVAILPSDAVVEDLTSWGAKTFWIFTYGMSTDNLNIKSDINSVVSGYGPLNYASAKFGYQFMGVSKKANPSAAEDLCILADKINSGETYYCDSFARYDDSKYSYDEAVADFKTNYPQFLGNNEELEYYSYKINYYNVDDGNATLRYSSSINSAPTLKKSITGNVSDGLEPPMFTMTFMGWNTKVDGSGKTYMPGEKIELESANPIIDLYAVWKEELSKQVIFGTADSSGTSGSIDIEYKYIGLSYSGTADSPWSTSDSILVGTVKSLEGECDTTHYQSTLSITNLCTRPVIISFDYQINLNGGTIKIDGTSVSANGSYSKEFAPAEKIDIYIKSASTTDATKVTINNMYVTASE